MKAVPHDLIPITEWDVPAQAYLPRAFGCRGCLQEFPTEDDPGWEATSCLGNATSIADAKDRHRTGHANWVATALGHDNPAERRSAIKGIRRCPTCHPHWLNLCSTISVFMAGRAHAG